ncbi:MAG: hypothetical protein KF833_19965 [Verrucomicrobiae bacterium]|nr:hypothetical protein [Verrucomicrobiae bacterium]
MMLVDTSLWIEFLRRRGDARAKQAVARMLEAELAAFTCPVRHQDFGFGKQGCTFRRASTCGRRGLAHMAKHLKS